MHPLRRDAARKIDAVAERTAGSTDESVPAGAATHGASAAAHASAPPASAPHVLAPHRDADVAARARAALDEHWALRSLRRPRRDEIVAAAELRRLGASGEPRPPQPARSGRGTRRKGAATRAEVRASPSADVSDADILHLAGAYDLAGRDALAMLHRLRADADGEAGDAVSERLGARDAEHERTLRAQMAIAAARAFALQITLPVVSEPEGGTTPAADVADVPRGDSDDRADPAAVQHRLLHLATLAEIGHRRGEWLQWLDANPAATAMIATADPSSGSARPMAGDAVTEPSWELRFRALAVGAWIQILRRSGPSGLDDAMAMIARLREERPVAEPTWLAAVDASGEALTGVRARFRLFSLAHLADAAVDTLLFLRHGDAYATRAEIGRAVHRRLQLAREAAAGDVQLDGVLTWLGEAAHHVILRGSPQLEIAIAR